MKKCLLFGQLLSVNQNKLTWPTVEVWDKIRRDNKTSMVLTHSHRKNDLVTSKKSFTGPRFSHGIHGRLKTEVTDLGGNTEKSRYIPWSFRDWNCHLTGESQTVDSTTKKEDRRDIGHVGPTSWQPYSLGLLVSYTEDPRTPSTVRDPNRHLSEKIRRSRDWVLLLSEKRDGKGPSDLTLYFSHLSYWLVSRWLWSTLKE